MSTQTHNFAATDTTPTFVTNLSIGDQVRNAKWDRTMVITNIMRDVSIVSGVLRFTLTLSHLDGTHPQNILVENPDSIRWGIVFTNVRLYEAGELYDAS